MTTSPEKRVSFAAQLEVSHGDSLVLSPKNSNVQDEHLSPTSDRYTPTSLSEIRKDYELVPNPYQQSSSKTRGEGGPWSMECFIDTLCVSPGERGAEVTLVPRRTSESKENIDAPGQKLPDYCSSSDSSSIIDTGDPESEEVDEDAFLPVDEDTAMNESAFLPDTDDAFLPQDESAFLPAAIDAALLDVAVDSQDPNQEAQEVELTSKDLHDSEVDGQQPSEEEQEDTHIERNAQEEEQEKKIVHDSDAIERKLTSTECESIQTHEEAEVSPTCDEDKEEAIISLLSEETEVIANRSVPRQEASFSTPPAGETPRPQPEETKTDTTNSVEAEEAPEETVSSPTSSVEVSSEKQEENESVKVEEPESHAEVSNVEAEISDSKLATGDSTTTLHVTHAEAEAMEKTAANVTREMSQEKEIEGLRIQLQESEEKRRKAVGDAVKEIESRMKRDSIREVAKVAESPKFARSRLLDSRDKEICQREQKLEEEKKEQVLKIAGAMKVATAVRNEFTEEEEFGELKTLKQSLGTLMKNQKATIKSLEASVKHKEKEIAGLKLKCKETQDQQKETQSSLRVAEKTLISIKAELPSTRRKLKDTEEALGQAKADMESQDETIAAMKCDLKAAAQDQEIMKDLVSALNETRKPIENEPTELRDQLKVAVETMHKENKQMQSLTNDQSEQLLKTERTIAELTAKVATLRSTEETAKSLRDENQILKKRLEQMESEVRDLLESVQMADSEKVGHESDREQQMQTINEQLRSLSSIVSSKSKLSACDSGEEIDALVAPHSSDSVHEEKASASTENFESKGTSVYHSGTGTDGSAESVDPIFSCSGAGGISDVSNSTSSIAPAKTPEQKEEEGTSKEELEENVKNMKETLLRLEAPTPKSETTKKIWSLSCGCYAPPCPSASYQADVQIVDTIPVKNSIISTEDDDIMPTPAVSEDKQLTKEDNDSKPTPTASEDKQLTDEDNDVKHTPVASEDQQLTEEANDAKLLSAASKDKQVTEEMSTTTSDTQNGQNEVTTHEIDETVIDEVILEGAEDSDLHQIEAILNSFSSIVADLSVQKSSSGSLSEPAGFENGVEMTLSNQEEQRENSAAEGKATDTDSQSIGTKSDQEANPAAEGKPTDTDSQSIEKNPVTIRRPTKTRRSTL